MSHTLHVYIFSFAVCGKYTGACCKCTGDGAGIGHGACTWTLQASVISGAGSCTWCWFMFCLFIYFHRWYGIFWCLWSQYWGCPSSTGPWHNAKYITAINEWETVTISSIVHFYTVNNTFTCNYFAFETQQY